MNLIPDHIMINKVVHIHNRRHKVDMIIQTNMKKKIDAIEAGCSDVKKSAAVEKK
jgi:hypothetical protein